MEKNLQDIISKLQKGLNVELDLLSSGEGEASNVRGEAVESGR